MKEAISLIVKFEHFEKNAYPDPRFGWGVPTIGYGTTVYPDGRKVGAYDRCTREEAARYMEFHIEQRILPVLNRIPTFPSMSPRQKAAIISFAYNIGENFYGKEGFASITRVCDYPDRWGNRDWIISQFIKYRKGAELGLGRRRYAEALVFCGEDPLYAYKAAYDLLKNVADILALPDENEALNPPK